MNSSKIRQLLDKYFAGDTSLEEEAALVQYFQGKDIDPALAPFQDLFRFLDAERQTTLSPEFEDRFLEKITAPKRLPLRWIVRIAAAAAVVAGIVFFLPRPDRHTVEPIATIDWEQYEPETEEEALAQATAALQLLAEKLNSGARVATDELQKIEKTSSVFK